MVEIVRPVFEQIPEWLLIVTPAVAWWLKAIVKEKRTPNREEWNQLEIHHKKPVYQGGQDTEDNLVAVTRVEHAKTHYDMARKSKDRQDRQANDWAVRQIVSRMTDEEREEFNKRIHR